MGIFDLLIDNWLVVGVIFIIVIVLFVFSTSQEEIPSIYFDDTEIQTLVRNYPKSLTNNYRRLIADIAENIHQVYTAANNKEFTIGIIGDYAVGKSSFINGILGDRILPVSANPTTAVITKIKYGRKPKVVVRYRDGKEEEMTYETFMKFSAFNLGDFQERMASDEILRFKNVVDAVMFVKSDFLKNNNLCIVDTLGLSAHESDNKRTIVSIRDFIATIYLCSERCLSNKDVEYISTYLSPEKEEFFLCINRIDLVRRTERNDVSQLVKMKMDGILQKSEQNKKFPSSRIYQLSSLYQEFANGFTEHEDWHEGINYQERSGFMQIMNDVCKYVKENAETARKEAINKQLQIAKTQLVELMALRKNEFENQIDSNSSKILRLKDAIQENTKHIAYINTLFETLFNTLYSLSHNIYDEFCHSVNSEWEEKMNNTFVNQISFDFGDYLILEKDIIALKLNVFKSMSDDRYAQFDSLTPFVDHTALFMKDRLQPILDKLFLQTINTIKTFAEQNALNEFFEKGEIINCEACNSVEQNEVICAMYRAVALAAVESTWMKSRSRRVKMFNAAKTESLKTIEKPFKDSLKLFYSGIQQYLDSCNTKAIEKNIKLNATMDKQIQDLEAKNALLMKIKEQEIAYFNNSINILSHNKKLEEQSWN